MARPVSESGRIELSCNPELKARLVKAARQARQSLTAFILTAAEERARAPLKASNVRDLRKVFQLASAHVGALPPGECDAWREAFDELEAEVVSRLTGHGTRQRPVTPRAR